MSSANRGEGQAGPSAGGRHVFKSSHSSRDPYCLTCLNDNPDHSVCFASAAALEAFAAALRASEAALADMTSTAESWEQEYNLERLRLATMTKERNELRLWDARTILPKSITDLQGEVLASRAAATKAEKERIVVEIERWGAGYASKSMRWAAEAIAAAIRAPQPPEPEKACEIGGFHFCREVNRIASGHHVCARDDAPSSPPPPVTSCVQDGDSFCEHPSPPPLSEWGSRLYEAVRKATPVTRTPLTSEGGSNANDSESATATSEDRGDEAEPRVGDGAHRSPGMRPRAEAEVRHDRPDECIPATVPTVCHSAAASSVEQLPPPSEEPSPKKKAARMHASETCAVTDAYAVPSPEPTREEPRE